MIDRGTVAPHDTLSILVVDDDRWTTRAVVAALRKDPSLSVLGAAHSGEEAVSAHLKFHPDVVLMDVNMPPGMSGIDATAQIMRSDPGARIVLLTTVSPGPGIARALEAGALAAVNKTAPEDVLIQTIRSVVTGEGLSSLGTLAHDIAISGDPLPDAHAMAPSLTDREHATLMFICEGLSYEEISQRMSVSISTVKSHSGRLRDKLGAHSHAQLLVQAMKFKFFTPS